MVFARIRDERLKMITEMSSALSALKDKRPLVHCITNYVSANDSANCLIAIGASPIMADNHAETAEIAASADALVLNMGIPSEDKLSAMIKAGKSANSKSVPVVFDPVGVSQSALRKAGASSILEQVNVDIIKGNAAEIEFLAAFKCSYKTDQSSLCAARGVDAHATGKNKAHLAAQILAKTYQCAVVVSGREDLITDGSNLYIVKNGSEMMSKITGTGCMLSCIIGAFIGAKPKDKLISALAAASIFSIAGERANSILENLNRIYKLDSSKSQSTSRPPAIGSVFSGGTYRGLFLDAISRANSSYYDDSNIVVDGI